MAAYDHIVVGGGISGMASAIILASQGRRVALVEAAPDLCPTVRGFYRQGALFDTGLHYLGGLGRGDPLHVYFEHLGIAGRLELLPCHAHAMDRIWFGESGGQYDIPFGFESLIEQFGVWFPQEKKAINEYFDAVREVLAASPFLNFSREFAFGEMLHAERGTLGEFLDALTANEALKNLLCYQNFFYGVPPSEALFTTHANVAGTFYLSTHTIAGGGRALVNACRERLGELGVDVRCGQAVAAVEMIPDRQVSGVRLQNNELLQAPSCVWTAHPKALIQAAPLHAFRPAFCKRINSLQDTTSAVMLYGISREPVPELDGCNMFLWGGAGYEKDLRGESALEECTVFLSAAEKQENGQTAVTAIAPQSAARWERWAASRHGLRPEDYLREKRAMLAAFEAEIRRRAPELFASVAFVDGATPLTFKHYCHSPTGSLYGPKHSVNQFNPAPITKAEGLVLAGQGVVAPGILGAIVSAYLACGILIGHEPLHKSLRRCA